ncbi:MAG: zinc-dependent dehydrogenase [Elusimicrobia bacterium]|nr:zinc-dependent dehydrogenase [Candidatus Liberimonas magnetica]
MHVAMYYNNKDVRLEEMPTPKIKEGEILVKVQASGICGSDVMEWYRIKKAPLVLGHEISGEIAEVAPGVKGYKVGERVFVSHHVPCNECKYCLNDHHTACQTLHTTNYDPGGFSEYIRVPKVNMKCGVFKLPDSVSYEEGTFIEPLACVIRAQEKAGFKKGQNIVILGGGISGILHLMLARANGANKIVVTDVNKYRLKMAKELEADTVLNAAEDVPSLIKQVFGGNLADQVIVCAGVLTAFEQSLKCVDRGGVVLCFATTQPGINLALPLNDFWRNEITIMPSYGAAPQDIEAAIGLLKAKKIDVNKMVTQRLELKDTGLGFKLVAEGKESLKVIIEPQKKS